MSNEDRELLLKDLSARLPYGIKFPYHMEEDSNHRECDCIAVIDSISEDCIEFTYKDNGYPIDWSCSLSQVKPYLRPMLSMTEEEFEEFHNYTNVDPISWLHYSIDWLNAHHFDYRGLIEKDLAIEVTKENNPYEDRKYSHNTAY